MQIFRVMHAVPYSNQAPVQDVIANIHSYFTCNLLIALAVLLSYKQFGGQPIECMLPLTGTTFSGAWEQYAESYCWSEDTYYVPFTDAIESFTKEQRREKRISYYQWIPFFLLFQAACFKLPTLIWKYFAGQSGMRVGEVLRFATNEANTEPATRSSNIFALCVHLQGALKFQYRLTRKRLTPHKILRFLNMKYASYYVTFIYLISKACFLLNVLLQTDLLNRYFVPNATAAFGFYAWRDLWYGNKTWEQMQCVLLLNIFTEKAFIVLWAWYQVLTAVTLYNFTSWVFSLINPRSSQHFIINHLEMHGGKMFANESPTGLEEVQMQVERFIDKYLKTDGMFILRLIAQHADVVFTTELIAMLWDTHYRIEQQRAELRLADEKWKRKKRRFEVLEARVHSPQDRETDFYYKPHPAFPLPFHPQAGGHGRRDSHQVSRPFSPPRLKRAFSNEELKRNSLQKSNLSDDSDDDRSTHDSARGHWNPPNSPIKHRKH